MQTANPYTTSGSLGLGSSPSNPYLGQQITGLTNASNLNLQNNVLPGIDGGAVAAGGYGGSRQGIAEGNAIGQAQTGLDASIGNLYSGAYTADQAYNLGLGGLANNAQANANTAQANQNTFYTNNRSLDQSGTQLGATLQNNADTALVNQGTALTAAGTTEQQAPWTVTNNAGNAFSQYAGLGGTQIGTQQGSTLGAAAGLGLAGAQIANLGFGGKSTTPTWYQDSTGNWVYGVQP